jgi:hypothetical protein
MNTHDFPHSVLYGAANAHSPEPSRPGGARAEPPATERAAGALRDRRPQRLVDPGSGKTRVDAGDYAL